MISEHIIDNLAAGINPTGDYVRALLANPDSTPEITVTESGDFNDASVANELEALRSYIEYLTRKNTVDDFHTEKLDTIVYTFLRLERLFLETDDNLILRMKSLSERRFNQFWMSPSMIRDVLSYYVTEGRIWVIPYAVPETLIVNGVFDNDLTGWTAGAEGASLAAYSSEERFEGNGSAKLETDSAGSIAWVEQALSLLAGTYRINFFLMTAHADTPACTLMITRDSDGYFWNGSGWIETEAVLDVDPTDRAWDSHSVPFILPGDDTVTIRFQTAGHEDHSVFIDAVEVGMVPSYPYMDVIVLAIGQSGNFMPLSGGADDPIPGDDYENKGYFDNSYIGGSGTAATPVFIQDMLDIVRPAGVRVRYRQVYRNV